MPLSWNEIRNRALEFSKEWKGESSESAEAKSFWDAFFNIFGITRRRIASFEVPVKKSDRKGGFVDLLWKGVLLVEHKSLGKNLDRAYGQALDYFPGIKERELPRYIVVSDFARFRLYDLDEDTQHEFALEELHKNIKIFGFIAGYQTHVIKEQDPVNIKAAEQMGKLHDQMKEVGYKGHPLEIYLVRLLFCLFAEDTGIFERQQFQEYIEIKTTEDGSDLAFHLDALFYILNTPEEKRLKNRDEHLSAFPYVNGKLFEERLSPASFDKEMRQALLDCCIVDWSRISPAIFGSLFQSIMDKEARRSFGAHYTSEKNILKLLKPLFLDQLWEEFEKVKKNKNKIIGFHKKLSKLNFLDPACGCGNFLVIAYRELRLLELEILRISNTGGQLALDVHQLIQLDVDRFYGIEVEEFPAQIAQVALWLMDHQMNMIVSEEFGTYFSRIPLFACANIVIGNALRMDWNDVIPAEKLDYIMGNPPFVGKSFQSKEQKADMEYVFYNTKQYTNLDYVTAWYIKALQLCKISSLIKCAFVSTNSITQGEQAVIMWPTLLEQGTKIHFAHRTFSWSNEAKGIAAVHCVIIGFGLNEVTKNRLFEYEDIKGEPHEIIAKNINPYLVDAPNMVLANRKHPICGAHEIIFGSKPTDGGNLILKKEEKDDLIKREPAAKEYIREYLSAVDFINKRPRYCLWLKNCPPDKLKVMPSILARVEGVRNFRKNSTKKATVKDADTPALFAEDRQPVKDYLAIPKTTSERRLYIPIGFMDKNVVVASELFTISDAELYDFGILSSIMHNAWTRTVCGRLKSDYRYSAGIVYNNFPWPLHVSDKHKYLIETKAQAVLEARDQFKEATLADLYDPLTIPPDLMKAHQALDKAVDKAYGKTNFKTEAERVAFLFELYQNYTG